MPEVRDPAPPADPGFRRRVCGRCRLMFDGDPSDPPTALAPWWVCPECRTVLLPNRHKSDEAVALRRAGAVS